MPLLSKTTFSFGCAVAVFIGAPVTAQQADPSASQTISRLLSSDQVSEPASDDGISDPPTEAKPQAEVRVIMVDGEPQLQLPERAPPPELTASDDRQLIELTGETVVRISPDGTVEIFNNGKTVLGAGFSARERGQRNAALVDKGEPMDISVEKTVSMDGERRSIHVEIDMVSAPQ